MSHLQMKGSLPVTDAPASWQVCQSCSAEHMSTPDTWWQMNYDWYSLHTLQQQPLTLLELVCHPEDYQEDGLQDFYT